MYLEKGISKKTRKKSRNSGAWGRVGCSVYDYVRRRVIVGRAFGGGGGGDNGRVISKAGQS